MPTNKNNELRDDFPSKIYLSRAQVLLTIRVGHELYSVNVTKTDKYKNFSVRRSHG